MLVQQLKRVFHIKSAKVNLPDPNPALSPQEVLQFYSPQYPELTTATIDGPKIQDDSQVFEFVSTVGTKG